MIVGAILFAIYSISWLVLFSPKRTAGDFVAVVTGKDWIVVASIAMVALILMMFAFGALYSRICASSGVVGLAGFVFVELAYLLQACKVTWEIFIYPTIAVHPIGRVLLQDRFLMRQPLVAFFRAIASGTILVGITLFCLALVRSRELPRVAGGLVFAGALAYGTGPAFSIHLAISGVFVFAVGCLILGVRLWQARSDVS